MNTPEDLRYSKDHEWVRQEAGTVTIGITDFAQSELGDIVYVELPAIGSSLEAGKEFGTVESVKAVSEVFAPLSGEVVQVNESLRDNPEAVNTDPYGEGWILKVRPSDASDLKALLTSAEYSRFVEGGSKH